MLPAADHFSDARFHALWVEVEEGVVARIGGQKSISDYGTAQMVITFIFFGVVCGFESDLQFVPRVFQHACRQGYVWVGSIFAPGDVALFSRQIDAPVQS